MAIPYIEKENGTKLFNKLDFQNALKHYAKSLLSLKFLFDQNIITDEQHAEKYIKEITVRISTDISQSQYGSLLPKTQGV